MIVEMCSTAASDAAVYESGKTYNVPDATAREWVRLKHAKPGDRAKLTRTPILPDPGDTPDSGPDADEDDDE